MEKLLNDVKNQTKIAIRELIMAGKLKEGSTVIIGCSTSEVIGGIIGKNGSPQVAEAIFDTAYELLSKQKINLAAQCCEHLNRAIVIEEKAAKGIEKVCVVPQVHAGGSFATEAFKKMENPVVVEEISADAGLDIGGTLIGMHLKRVAVPVRLSVKNIGNALLLAAYTRPKFIGGIRARYE
ncbi:MAG: TIGR01440 family protein [Clostridia bacterium]|nr:TIGR01440 family protein [Clostridia bacterium]